MGVFTLRYSRKQIEKLMDIGAVKDSISEAEVRTSGEIRVSISRFFWGSVRRAAEKAFVRLDMMETRDRNGILFFIVPARKRFAIIGDTGIHSSVGQEFWDHLAALLRKEFKEKRFTEGLVAGIRECGKKLSAHFPYEASTDVNELPDDIDVH